MQVRRGRDRIEVKAPAKINLLFEVLGRRVDGFHEIETLMVPISLYDTLTATDDPSGRVQLSAEWAAGDVARGRWVASAGRPADDQTGDLPQGEQNICVLAVRLLAEKAAVSHGLQMTLVKRIPSAAGLGGGSSDAAAALVGANRAWNLGWSTERLAVVAAELGSDVPFFLAEGAAICRGRGEKVERTGNLGNLNLVVVRPPAGLSTASVYRECRPGERLQTAEAAVRAFRVGELAAIGKVAPNRLLEPARRLSPWIDRTLDRLKAEGCAMVGMSGSGTSCFALCRSRREAVRVSRRLAAGREPIGQVWAVRSL